MNFKLDNMLPEIKVNKGINENEMEIKIICSTLPEWSGIHHKIFDLPSAILRWVWRAQNHEL